jgi:hypothetical protein
MRVLYLDFYDTNPLFTYSISIPDVFQKNEPSPKVSAVH